MDTRLKSRYRSEIVPALMEQFSYTNIMEVPRLEKIVVNMGVGEAVQDAKALDGAVADMTAITGQKPAVRRSKKAISNFKLREGVPVGCAATLRGDRMYEFLDRLISFSLPQVRDFRGMSSKSFDGRGNYSLGVREQLIFPEVDYDKVDQVRGLNITLVTSTTIDGEAQALLRLFGMPFSN